MASKIPIFSEQTSNFTMTLAIEDIIVELTMTYNIRNQRWYFSLITDNYEIKYLKLIENFPLIYTHKSLFPELAGDFIVVKEVNNIGEVITYNNLGRGWNLYYYTESEMEDWFTENGI